MNIYNGVVEKLPEVMRIEPASSCNLKCTHCPTGFLSTKEGGGGGIMSPETFEFVLKEVQNLKPRVVVLYHGGEPFLNKNIFEMIQRIKSSSVGFVKTVTNGMLLNEKRLTEIVKSGIDSVEFSLDGKSPEENNELRVGSDYNKVSMIIKQLIAIKHNLGATKPSIYISNCQIANDEAEIKRESAVPKHLARDFSQYNPNEIQFKLCYAIWWPGFPLETSAYRLATSLKTEENLNYCSHPLETITIRYNGDVVACCYDIASNYVTGNIRETPIDAIWNNERFKVLRKSIHSRNYLPLCRNCHQVIPKMVLVRK